jgi:hypothetical protein
MEMIVEIRNVYGVEQVYPVCNKAKLFASIAGTKMAVTFKPTKSLSKTV